MRCRPDAPVRRVTDDPNEMRKSSRRALGYDQGAFSSLAADFAEPMLLIMRRAMRSHFSAAVRREFGARELPSSRNLFARASLHSRWALVCLGVLILAGVSAARAKDDNENSTPTAWWFYTGQSVAEIGATLTAKNARIVDIAPDNPAASSFTVTYVQNAGPYAKRWWWYVGVDASTLAKNLSANQARTLYL